MTFADLPGMLTSDTRGWQDVARMHPTVPRLMLLYVVPTQLIPPALFVFAVASGRGELFTALVLAEPAGDCGDARNRLGVLAWVALMVLQALLLSMLMGWR